MLATVDGFITDAIITSANIDERVAAWDLVSAYRQITMFGDKGYTGDDFVMALKKEILIFCLLKRVTARFSSLKNYDK